MKNDWNDLLTYEKVFRILTLIFSVATLVLVILSETSEWNIGSLVQLGVGLSCLCEAIHFWRKKKGLAIFCMCVFIFAIVAVIILTFL